MASSLIKLFASCACTVFVVPSIYAEDMSGMHHDHAAMMSSAATAPMQLPWGVAGEAKAVRRTVEISVTDDRHFVPDVISVKRGETLRIVLRNRGKEVHQLVLGTPEALKAHADMMRQMPDMKHTEAWIAEAKPGSQAEVLWQFNRAGQFAFGCVLGGHYDARMIGKIRVE